jgi:acyl-coenzyme A thioesterase PaaI-like protein
MPAGSEVLAVEFKINLMAPAKGEAMIARGRVQKSGRTLTICTVEVSVVENGAEREVALMQQTCMAVSDSR